MASFAELFIQAQKRHKNSTDKSAGERFREILGIVRSHKLRDGLTPEKMVALIQDLGPTFVKLGQIASTHPDVLPKEYCDALGSLRTKANPMDFETVKEQVERELGKPLEELFAYFDEHAVGSASIAQVHRAQLPDSTVVAVKVQRPGIVEKVCDDLAILERLVELYELASHSDGQISLKELVEELARTSRDELDFQIEAGHIDRFYANNAEREGIGCPQCYRDYTTSAVLTEDFMSSPCVEDIDKIPGLDDTSRERLAYLIASNYMAQIMEDGFFHADPHAGNVLIADGGIQWIDFGMMGTMTTRERDQLERLIGALLKGDAYSLKRALLQVCKPRSVIDHGALLELCEELIDEFINVDLESFDTSALINRMMTKLQESGFDIAPFLVSLGRGLVTLEGTIRLVSPRLNIMQVLSEYARSSFDLGRVKQRVTKLVGQTVDSAEALAGLPSQASATLDMLQKGQTKIGVDMQMSDKLGGMLKQSINVLALTILAAALFMGSCVLCLTNLEPQVLGVPMLGIVGFASGLALAIYVFWQIHTKDRR